MNDAQPCLPTAPATTSWRGLLTAPISPATWRSWSQGAIAVVTTSVLFTLVFAFVACSGALSIVVVGLPLMAGALLCTSGFARLERTRLHAILEVSLADPTYRKAAPGAAMTARVKSVITDRRRWTEVLYFVAAFGLMLLLLITMALFAAGIAAVTYPLYRHVGALNLPIWTVSGMVVGGAVLIFIAPTLAQMLSRSQTKLAHSLLGADPERSAQFAADARIDDLAQSRSAVVDAADAERRRIERDLHDGAQQRLVALGVDLGIAKRSKSDPRTAEIIDHAQAEIAATLSELRDLVRGIHPAILDDRGLDAALSALAARSPVPVNVSVTDPAALETTSRTAKTAAYFVAAEALTNVARHARASSATLEAGVTNSSPRKLVVTVVDDGVGGATAAPGGGLAGLTSRVHALDGTLTIESAPDFGTRVCASIPDREQ